MRVKSFALDKPTYKSLASYWGKKPYKILDPSSPMDRLKYGMLGGAGLECEVIFLSIDRPTYQIWISC